jgi:hypothetical protein
MQRGKNADAMRTGKLASEPMSPATDSNQGIPGSICCYEDLARITAAVRVSTPSFS